MKLRKCSKCKVEKEMIAENFYRSKSEVGGFTYNCKSCRKIEYTASKKEYYRIRYQEKNEYYRGIRKKNHKYVKYISTEDTRKKQCIYSKNRRDNDPEFKLMGYTRNRINECVKLFQYKKLDTTLGALGCSISEYVKHIESKWSDNMHWGNHGEYWEIDHIHPLSKGGSFHYTNTQPLTVIENRIKGSKID